MNKNAWVLTCNTLALGNEKKGLTLPPFFDTDLLSSRTSVKKGGRVALFCGIVEKNKLVQQTQMCNYIATNNFIISLLKSIYVI